jgi:hypothetical protein
LDLESKLCKSIFYKGGTSSEVGFGEEDECGIVCIKGGINGGPVDMYGFDDSLDNKEE